MGNGLLSGAFLTGREAAKRMVTRERGTIIFTGATAGYRGAQALPLLQVQNMRFVLGTKHGAENLVLANIHVAHVVVDGAIDTDFIKETFPDLYAKKEQDGILNPVHIARNYWHLSQQRRDAWTHELDPETLDGTLVSVI